MTWKYSFSSIGFYSIWSLGCGAKRGWMAGDPRYLGFEEGRGNPTALMALTNIDGITSSADNTGTTDIVKPPNYSKSQFHPQI